MNAALFILLLLPISVLFGIGATSSIGSIAALASAAVFAGLAFALLSAGHRLAPATGADLSEAGAGPADTSPAEERRFLWRIFFIALGLRVFVCVLIDAFVSPYGGFLSRDHGQYEMVGRQLVAYWHGDAPYPQRLYTVDHKGYWYYVGGLFYVFGYKPLIPKLINCVAGALAVVVTYEITRMLFDAFSARLAAYFVAFFPSYILWSGLNLKDMPMVLCILCVIWLTLKLQEKFSLVTLALLIVAMLGLGVTRGYLMPIVGAAIVVSLFLRGQSTGLAFLAALLVFGSFFFIINKLGVGEHYVRGNILEVIQQHREVSAYGGSAFMEHVDVSDPVTALLYLPIGLVYFLFGPFPTSITGPRQLLALPEILAFYCLLPSIVKGLVYAIRFKFRQTLILISILVLVTCTYSLGESNLGTAYRHRIQVLALLLIFAAVGISLKRRQRAGVAVTAT